MKLVVCVACGVALAGVAAAQRPSISLSTETAVGVFARDGNLLDLQFLAANTPIPQPVSVHANVARSSATTTATPELPGTPLPGVHIAEVGSAVRSGAGSDPTAGTTSASAAINLSPSPHSFLLRIRGGGLSGAAAGVQGWLRVALSGDATAGSNASAAVDVGADGAVEFRRAVDGSSHRASIPVRANGEVVVRLTTSGLAKAASAAIAGNYRADLLVEFEPDSACEITPYGQGCGPRLSGDDVVRGNQHVFTFKVDGAFPNSPVALVFGDRPIAVILPPSRCPLLTVPLVLVGLRAGPGGELVTEVVTNGPLAGTAYMQAVPFRLSTTGGLEFTTSNGLKIDCDM